jgi:hypothetical protein
MKTGGIFIKHKCKDTESKLKSLCRIHEYGRNNGYNYVKMKKFMDSRHIIINNDFNHEIQTSFFKRFYLDYFVIGN